jgi:hypothetical protein
MARVKAELEEMRGGMAALQADKFALEQCVRFLAVKGGFQQPGASVEGTPSRSALATLQPPSLKDRYMPARDRPSTPPEARSLPFPILIIRLQVDGLFASLSWTIKVQKSIEQGSICKLSATPDHGQPKWVHQDEAGRTTIRTLLVCRNCSPLAS